MLACVCNVVFLRFSMELTNFNRSSIDRISLASMDAWIFTDSLDFGFNRIGLKGSWISGWMDVEFSKDWIRMVLQDFGFCAGSGFGFFRIFGFRFSVGIVALTKQRCNTFLIDTKPFRRLVAFRRRIDLFFRYTKLLTAQHIGLGRGKRHWSSQIHPVMGILHHLHPAEC